MPRRSCGSWRHAAPFELSRGRLDFHLVCIDLFFVDTDALSLESERSEVERLQIRTTGRLISSRLGLCFLKV